MTCDAFIAAVDDLALGDVPEPKRARLLEHAASCASCSETLRDLSATVDQVLELAPHIEPPVGFESRAVRAMTDARPAATTWRLHAWRTIAVAVVSIAAGLLGGLFIARAATDGANAPAAAIVSATGTRIGAVSLASAPSPHMVVLLNRPATWRGAWLCQLRNKDGSWVNVGAWTAHEPTQTWSATIDRSLVGATAMRITNEDGKVIATASLLQ